MKTSIESLNSKKQINGITFVEDANSTITINEVGLYVRKLDYAMESKTFKTFAAAKKYMYR